MLFALKTVLLSVYTVSSIKGHFFRWKLEAQPSNTSHFLEVHALTTCASQHQHHWQMLFNIGHIYFIFPLIYWQLKGLTHKILNVLFPSWFQSKTSNPVMIQVRNSISISSINFQFPILKYATESEAHQE